MAKTPSTTPKTLLGREQIFAAPDAVSEDVDCPEWGGTVRIRGLSGAERDRYEASLTTSGGKAKMNLANARARLIVLCAIDEDRRQVFSDQDVAALGRKSAKPLDRLWETARRLSGLSDEDVEEMEQDFESAQSESSSSD